MHGIYPVSLWDRWINRILPGKKNRLFTKDRPRKRTMGFGAEVTSRMTIVQMDVTRLRIFAPAAHVCKHAEAGHASTPAQVWNSLQDALP